MSNELVSHQANDIARAEDFLPLLSVEQAVARKTQINAYIHGIMKEGDDFGAMPGDSRRDAKKVLLKPGAEKLCSVFGLVPQYIKETVIEDWTGAEHGDEPLFYYEYRCVLYRGGRPMGEAIGSSNSWETKYRYRWVSEEQVPGYVGADGLHLLPKRGGKQTKFEPDFALAKKETGGQYGKPAEYWQMFEDGKATGATRRVQGKTLGKKTFDGWEITIDAMQYRIPNPDVADVVNTLQKMAQKRALVAAVLVVTNCSDAFTQDVEDFAPEGHTGPVANHEPEVMSAVLPEELAHLFGPEAPPKATTVAFEMCRRELMEVLPQNGEDEYRRILTANNITAKGNKIGDVRAACIQCWTLARQVKAKSGWKPPVTENEPIDASYERGDA